MKSTETNRKLPADFSGTWIIHQEHKITAKLKYIHSSEVEILTWELSVQTELTKTNGCF